MIQACLPMTEVTALHPIRSHTPVPPLLTLGFSACLEVCFPTFSPQPGVCWPGMSHGILGREGQPLTPAL